MTDFAEIAKWLLRTGYPFEMSVAKEFRARVDATEQAVYVVDAETNKPREVDVVATRHGPTLTGWHSFKFIVECKSNTAPWVVFVEKHDQMEPFSLGDWLKFTPSRGDADMECEMLTRAGGVDVPLWETRTPGYGIVCKKNEDKPSQGGDDAYDAVRKAAASALSVVATAPGASMHRIHAIPVVIKVGSIFECWLDDRGEIAGQEVNGSSVAVYMGEAGYVAVHVWSASALTDLVAKCVDTANTFLPLRMDINPSVDDSEK
ncbi:MAG TPA: hypothetical protein VM677_12845 [Actinokineospora sp.]|jgi:hypothetical protein|nr:hypothetical protein [Actinokineospora sp.]